MGSITRSFANNITTSGVLLPASLNNNSISNVTAYNAAIATGNMVLISSQTASNSASISFTTGIDSTYKEYQFWFFDVRPRTNDVNFLFNFSTDSGSNYNVTKTSTQFTTYHYENDSDALLLYDNGRDAAQDTGFICFSSSTGTEADKLLVGTFSLFNPASTTYVKHFMCTVNHNTDDGNELSRCDFAVGYGNTTSAVNAIQFKAQSGNMDGTILMYGIK